MVQISEGTFTIENQSLYTRTWLPDGTPKAKLVLIHGFSDHVNLYNDLGNAMANGGIAMYGFDQRGWGRSVKTPADRGKTGPTAMVLADIVAFIEPLLDDSSNLPVFVMGHSMGGGQVLTLAGDRTYEDRVVKRVQGWILEAPFIAWPAGQAPSWLKINVGRFAGRFLPYRQLEHVIPPKDLTRNQEVVKILENDKLCHNLGTLEGLASLLDRTVALASGKTKLLPSVKAMWLGHGTDDKTCDHDASKKFFDEQTALQDKEFRSYAGWYHQMHTEPDREQFFQHVIEWVSKRVPAQDVAKPEVEVAAGSKL
ncbi:hypothetical protein PspLS_06624 [Pyricularia sp. CBS 133598]|nr:hypothetical protein PspLS_06624 [Pyricularia sp. CBS 133598]